MCCPKKKFWTKQKTITPPLQVKWSVPCMSYCTQVNIYHKGMLYIYFNWVYLYFCIVCQWLATGQWFSPVSSTNKTDRHDIAEILFKVALNTIKQTSKQTVSYHIQHKIKLICRSKCYIFILNNNRRKSSWKRMSKRFPPFILNQIL